MLVSNIGDLEPKQNHKHELGEGERRRKWVSVSGHELCVYNALPRLAPSSLENS